MTGKDNVTGDDTLQTYRSKRHSGRTAEPGTTDGAGAGETVEEPGGRPRFVVQIHDATTTHFDFRLEAGGVLKSWSVPKGPSGDPQEKRLAMPTEDHPLEYRTFEGVIPEGEYGGGSVIVWDVGTYESLDETEDVAAALAEGHLSFRLHGGKLRGSYALTRFRGGGSGDADGTDGKGGTRRKHRTDGTGGDGREAWLLVKKSDDRSPRRDAPDPARARSALSSRTLRQVTDEERPRAADSTGERSR